VENEREETALIRGLRPSEIGTRVESELLNQARCFLPELPLRDVDVLVVDRMGKDISGTGMDPNVIGRWLVPGMVEPVDTTVRTIVVLDLTERSHGNAIGLGLADFIPGSLARKVDLSATYINTLTSGWAGLRRGRLPIVLPTARTTLLAAIAAAGAIGRPVRMLWIHDTLSLSRFAASESLWPELTEDPATTVGSPFELAFGDDGALLPAPQ
jgi:hypothetical protein